MRIAIPRLTPAFALILAAASCGNNADSVSLGAASGNTLSEAQIDAALGPADQSVHSATRDSSAAGNSAAATNRSAGA
jgi:hypothetical protein